MEQAFSATVNAGTTESFRAQALWDILGRALKLNSNGCYPSGKHFFIHTFCAADLCLIIFRSFGVTFCYL